VRLGLSPGREVPGEQYSALAKLVRSLPPGLPEKVRLTMRVRLTDGTYSFLFGPGGNEKDFGVPLVPPTRTTNTLGGFFGRPFAAGTYSFEYLLARSGKKNGKPAYVCVSGECFRVGRGASDRERVTGRFFVGDPRQGHAGPADRPTLSQQDRKRRDVPGNSMDRFRFHTFEWCVTSRTKGAAVMLKRFRVEGSDPSVGR
jgi:hypothetical protein